MAAHMNPIVSDILYVKIYTFNRKWFKMIDLEYLKRNNKLKKIKSTQIQSDCFQFCDRSISSVSIKSSTTGITSNDR